ncbi:cell surface protein SprA [Bacteroidales bacterium KHT7]|nr:cell surface protein SprA [Bacteroidales bacterium KHT7]
MIGFRQWNKAAVLSALVSLASANWAINILTPEARIKTALNNDINSEYKAQADSDSLAHPRFGVSKTVAMEQDELKENASDLKSPDNLKTEAEYNEKGNYYRVGNKLGNSFLNTPFIMSVNEYGQWRERQAMRAFFKQKNDSAFVAKGKDKFDFSDMHFDLGPAEKIFGKGGVQIKTQGSAEIKLGGNYKNTENPSLPLRSRRTFGLDFDEKINLSLNGKVGDKMKMNLNYNTDATFDFDTKKIKLQYEGKEDEIIKLLEGGNVSFPSNNSLISGASSLFGIRADMQFGKLKLQTVVSQKNSTSISVSSKGGAQTTPFEFSADNYDENRHFFLAQYFRDTYNANMAKLPNIMSGINITRVEVWVTNKNGSYTSPRNIVAFTDLGEGRHLSNPNWGGGSANPSNTSNTLYSTVSQIQTARDIEQVSTTLDGFNNLEGGVDYEKIENARMLTSSEYTLNSNFGFISLKSTLQTDQVLAVAFEYTYGGQTYQVGEFSTDIKDSNSALLVKLLKSTSNSPKSGTWKLMMRNVYSLGAYSMQKEKFRLDIKIQSDTTGIYSNYLPEIEFKDKTLLRLLGCDRLDNSNKSNPNGYFDYIEGYTVNSSTGRVYFPVVEPFGEDLKNAIIKGGASEATANKYCFSELYDSTKTVAKQIAEKNKFMLAGQYKASSGSEIQLGSMNIPQGSVVVTAGGVTLTENTDYTVDYGLGVVTIINQSIIDAGTSVNVSLESNTEYSLQRKTMLGMNWEYTFNKDFIIGGTLQHMSEKPLTTKVSMSEEPLNNSVVGFNVSYKKESQWLTNMIDKLPFVNTSAPSSINFTGEYARLFAGSPSGTQGGASYIDDFEYTKNGIDIRTPTAWSICSTPSDFEESKLSNDVRYGFNRAALSWYYIDPLFTRRSSSLTPSYIKSDTKQLSNHYVREVYEREIYPNKDTNVGETTTLSILNLAYYPSERGPYNLDPDLTYEGKLNNPSKRWGGMMRKLDTNDFETSNIEYVEFWMLDPFIYNTDGSNRGGDFYLNLGEISEDILKDGKKGYESGLPISDADKNYSETAWGRVPNTSTSVVYAFNSTAGARTKQDVGFNGLSDDDERLYPAYKAYLDEIRGKVSPAVYDSIYSDPANDDYHYFRGSDYDSQRVGILDRYRRINNPSGNSPESGSNGEKYDTAYKSVPDTEDKNSDYTMNEYEKYFQYHISIRPEDMVVGRNFIVDKRAAICKDDTKDVYWYQFRVPVDEYEKIVGNISDFSSIRFARMFLTGFEQPIILRFATLDLVRSDWRTYDQKLYTADAPATNATLLMSAVNIEENNDKTPVNYVLPPGISRVLDPSQSQLTQNNEQALSLVVKNLSSGDARAVYKGTNIDLRQYKRIQMYAHANALENDVTNLTDNQISMFVRLGSDYKNNYYEYEIPLVLTPEGKYHEESGRTSVWPDANYMDVEFSKFTKIKKARNKARNDGNVNFNNLYSEYDPEHPNNKISIMGNPTLGEIKTIMIGLRNNSREVKSAEVWVNELRLKGTENEGGWAAQGNLSMQLADLGSVSLQGHYESAGYGGLEQTLAERRTDDYFQYAVTTSFELGKLVPEKVKLSMPLYYSFTKERTMPKYNPFDTDMLLKDSYALCADKQEKDSLEHLTTTISTFSNLSFSNVKFNIASKNPMPYDPANFSFSFSRSMKYNSGENTDWEKELDWKGLVSYNYAPSYKPWQPFSKIKSKSKWYRILKEFNLNYLPQSISVSSDISRHYYELQERDIEALTAGERSNLPISFADQFLFNREMNVRWDLTKNLHMNLTTATHAEIEEPYVAVNKDLYPDEYTAWKDSVKTSIMHWGRPLDYQQTFTASFQSPLNKLPCFDWINADASYNSSYNWERGTEDEDGNSYGNTINMQRTINMNGKLNFETLYNKIPFLKEVNQKFARIQRKSNNQPKKKGNAPAASKPGNSKRFTKEVTLSKNKPLTLLHNRKSKRLIVTATTKDGKEYPIKYKVVNENKIDITNNDSVRVKVSVTAKEPLENKAWFKTAQYVARGLMMVRNASISYRNTYAMSLPGFAPEVGDFFGQRKGDIMAPGMGFAFGMVGDGYIQRAHDNGWLMGNDSLSSPATTNLSEDLQIKVTLEPVREFKIDLNASRTVSRARSIEYMYSGMPETRSGTLNMTIVSLKSAFASSGNVNNGYYSTTFNQFLNNLDIIQKRIEARYAGATYPNGTSLAGQTFDANNGTVNKYSADVMIPAFLSAYSKGNAMTSPLDIFPTLSQMMPNWKFTYSGLGKLSFFRRYFKSVNITHGYKSIFSIGSYNTFSTFQQYMGENMGFVTDVATGNPVPSSMFDVSTCSINESFSPLIGLNVTLHNNLTAKVEMKKTRILNLSMASTQIVETTSDDLVFGAGYKIVDFKFFGGHKVMKDKKSKKKDAGNSEESTAPAKRSRNRVSTDLNIRADFSLRTQNALCRNISTALTTANSGSKAIKLSISADYTFNRLLTMSAYYDRQRNVPLISTTAYPTTTVDFGLSMKFSLTR